MTIAQGYNAPIAIDTQSPLAAGTVTPDVSQDGGGSANQVVIQMPAGNITVANPRGAQPGMVLTLIVKQDSVGGRTITWGSAFKKNVALSAGANAVDTIQFETPDGVTWYQLGSALNLS